ncbi:MAG: hypothetical protein JWM14_2321 [Chitinophagaceae bacterium]|nr:hypothetical protein [Chitinophagaceae bacterium]
MKTEKIIGVLVFVGLIFKMMHWPGAGPILVLSLTALSLVYFWGGFYFLSDANLKHQKIALSIIAGAVFGMACIGILFRLMYWPGAKPMLYIGVFGLPALTAAVFLFKSQAEQELQPYFNKLLIRLALFIVIAVPLFFVSNKTLLTIQYPNDPEIVRIKSNHFDHPENEAYAKEYQEYVEAQRHQTRIK